MSRVNAFMEAGSDSGRRVSIGGRSAQDEVWGWLNTDTAGGERSMRVSAEVVGPGLRSPDRRKKDGDQRKTFFDVELPEPGHCTVRIMRKGGRMEGLLRAGALLVVLKGITEEAENPEHAAQCMDFSRETLEQLEADAKDASLLPDVELPGGVSLAHALACVALCEAHLPKAEAVQT